MTVKEIIYCHKQFLFYLKKNVQGSKQTKFWSPLSIYLTDFYKAYLLTIPIYFMLLILIDTQHEHDYYQ